MVSPGKMPRLHVSVRRADALPAVDPKPAAEIVSTCQPSSSSRTFIPLERVPSGKTGWAVPRKPSQNACLHAAPGRARWCSASGSPSSAVLVPIRGRMVCELVDDRPLGEPLAWYAFPRALMEPDGGGSRRCSAAPGRSLPRRRARDLINSWLRGVDSLEGVVGRCEQPVVRGGQHSA